MSPSVSLWQIPRQGVWQAWQWLRSHSFTPSWLPLRWRHPAVGYAVAGLLQLMAVLLTYVLAAALPRFVFPSAIVLLGVVFVALNWGALTGLLAAVVGVVLADAVILAPAFGRHALSSIEDALALACVVGVALAMSLLASSAARSKQRALEQSAQAHAREFAAQQVQAHMDEFLAIASHDLRSPLTVVSGYLDLATRSYASLASSVLDTRPDLAPQIERVRTHLALVDESNERLRRLVEVLFDTSRARWGTLDLTPVPCDLAALVHEQVAALLVSAPQRTVELDELVDGPVEVLADADRVGQVITNYLTNALKYSPADQPVRVRVGIAEGRARVAVQDQGPGLPVQEQERIWRRFYRAEGVQIQAQSAKGDSLGLGLYVCKRIIEGLGGAVGVHSEVGHGSTFWFELPLTKSLAKERIHPVTGGSQPGTSRSGGDRHAGTSGGERDAGKRSGVE